MAALEIAEIVKISYFQFELDQFSICKSGNLVERENKRLGTFFQIQKAFYFPCTLLVILVFENPLSSFLLCMSWNMF